MGNIFADKLYAKYNKDSQQSDFNIDAWSFFKQSIIYNQQSTIIRKEDI